MIKRKTTCIQFNFVPYSYKQEFVQNKAQLACFLDLSIIILCLARCGSLSVCNYLIVVTCAIVSTVAECLFLIFINASVKLKPKSSDALIIIITV